MKYAYISENPSGKERGSQLKIDDKGIGFLLNPVSRNSSFTQGCDEQVWYLDFFQGTLNRKLFNIGLKVEFSDTPKTVDDEQHYIARAMWLPREQAPEKEDARRISSGFLRRSNALEISNIRETTRGREFIVDRNGLVYISSDENQFCRIVLCLALTVAYGTVIQRCIESLVDSIKTGDYSALSKLYKEVLSFNATDYFSLPVKLDRHEILTAWKTLRQHWHLDELNNELIQQLSSIAKLNEERRRDWDIQKRHQFYIDQNKAWQKEQALRHQENQHLKQLRIEEEKRFEKEILNHKELTKAYREQKDRQENSQQKIESQHKKLNTRLAIFTLLFTVIATLNTTPSDVMDSLQAWFPFLPSLSSWLSTHAVELRSWILSHLG